MTETSHSTHPTMTGQMADVNGIRLYSQIYGDLAHSSGVTPLVVLHGGLGRIEMFGTLLDALAKNRPLIGVDLQGHGRTADVDRPLRFETMADDIAALVRLLGLPAVDLLGYSLGGGTALQTVIRHPAVVRKLALISTPMRQSGWYPEVIASMKQMKSSAAESAEAMKASPIYQDYAAVAPRPEDWPRLVEKASDLLSQPYDRSDAFAKIQSPTLIVLGDADSIPPAHAVEMFALLGGGQRDAGWDGADRPPHRLAILPGTTHYNSVQSPWLATLLPEFLDG
jgi:pimeloyl-ACP methyl ester carboxylesterase